MIATQVDGLLQHCLHQLCGFIGLAVRLVVPELILIVCPFAVLLVELVAPHALSHIADDTASLPILLAKHTVGTNLLLVDIPYQLSCLCVHEVQVLNQLLQTLSLTA